MAGRGKNTPLFDGIAFWEVFVNLSSFWISSAIPSVYCSSIRRKADTLLPTTARSDESLHGAEVFFLVDRENSIVIAPLEDQKLFWFILPCIESLRMRYVYRFFSAGNILTLILVLA